MCVADIPPKASTIVLAALLSPETAGRDGLA
jgi:hypothetical protein